MTDGPILGIVDGIHDAGAALFVGDRLVAAVNEERLSRVKLQGGFPRRAVQEVLRAGNIAPRDVRRVAVAGIATPSVPTRLCRPLQRSLFQSAGIIFDRPFSPLHRLADLTRYRLRLTTNRPTSALGRLERRLAGAALRRELGGAFARAPLDLVEHHHSHAAAAFFASPFERALVLTADSLGDGLSLAIAHGEGRRLERLFGADPFVSFGTFYSLVTRFLGFRPYRDEGKVLALAASGDAKNVPLPFPLRCTNGSLRYEGEWGLRAWRWLEPLGACSREDVAAWLQSGLEEGIVSVLRPHLDPRRTTDLCVAGGIFANVRLNLRLLETPGVRRLFVFPHMGDGGLAVGAGLAVLRPRAWRLSSLFLGPRYPERECARALGDLPCTRPADPADEVAALLAEGEVVALFDGRMEFGPRALGHRSVLAEAKDPRVRHDLNRRLQRTEFMPFAPVICEERAGERVEGVARSRDAARHMTCAFRATPLLIDEAPGAVHVDGTARCQIAAEHEHPRLHRILDGYARRTGRHTLINTSYNRHEEPMICTPADAVRTFLEGGLDALLLGPLLVHSPNGAHGGSG